MYVQYMTVLYSPLLPCIHVSKFFSLFSNYFVIHTFILYLCCTSCLQIIMYFLQKYIHKPAVELAFAKGIHIS